MGSYSFYLPKEEEKQVEQRLLRLAREQGSSVSQVIFHILENYFKKEHEKHNGKNKARSWVHAFCGCWQGKESAEDLIRLIEQNRSRFQPISL